MRTCFALALLVLHLPSSLLADENPAPPPRVAPGEVIVIYEDVEPARPAKQIRPKRVPPPYSKQAILEDRARRSWAILDVDTEGKVTSVRFIRRAGYGLDELAAKEAMGYRFEPAEDATGHRIPTRIVWLFEWPSYFRARTVSVIAVDDPCERMRSGGPNNLDSIHPIDRDCYMPSPAEIRAALRANPPPSASSQR